MICRNWSYRASAAALAFLAVVGCATTQRTAASRDADNTSIVVTNQGYNDMTIYVLEGGSVRRRLGIASAAQKTTLRIPVTLVGNGRELQFLADPIAGRQASVSQRIYVAPGDQVGLTILPP
jgi:hypothetical protein